MSGKKLTMLSMALLLVLVVPMPAVEGRSAPDDTYVVTNTNDIGAGSLRQAILSANGHAGADAVHFNIPWGATGCSADVCTIHLASALPILDTVSGLTIDGYTQPYADPPDGSNPAEIKIVIDGDGFDCFVVTGANHLIRGLVVQDCGYGFDIRGSNATANVIAGNHIGTDVDGLNAVGNFHAGVCLREGAYGNTIGGDEPAERNVISGNDYYGLWILSSTTHDNVVAANYLGTKAGGTSALPNNYYGVYIQDSPGNTIGGDSAGEGNVLSGNGQYGIHIQGNPATDNVIAGNTIGLSSDEIQAVPNSLGGIHLTGGASFTWIGGPTITEWNIIAGNGGDGVLIEGEGTTDNYVHGNLIGLNLGDQAGLGNSDGVQISGGAQDNVIGGSAVYERNVISGNAESGVHLEGAGTTGNRVSGNYIGTDTGGLRDIEDLGNGQDGVVITDGAAENVVGGDTAGRRNVIADNAWSGVSMYGTDTMSNTIAGNYIGVDAAGGALGNGAVGVYLASGARGNVIGGSAAGARNVIAGNGQDGVQIGDEGTVDNVVAHNYIGVGPTGLAAMPNQHDGVLIHGGASRNTVGDYNVISGNAWGGVAIYGMTTMTNTVSGNYIGTNASGTAAVANGYHGVYIGSGSDHNVVGAENVISGNTQDGVRIEHSATDYNRVEGNAIGTDLAGTLDLGNGWNGVRITGGARRNSIGGAAREQRNLISGNTENGVMVDVSGTLDNYVAGNYIGVTGDGASALGNTNYGVYLDNGTLYNSVGGPSAGERNVISGNFYGIVLHGTNTAYNEIVGNYVGLSADGTAAVPNIGAGVFLFEGASNNEIGGTAAGEGNVISGNGYEGVYLYGPNADGNQILGNTIGTTASGLAPLGNGWEGIYISGDCDDNVVGPGNRIAYNARDGVRVNGSGAIRNAITQNSIHTNGLLGIDLTEGANGGIAIPTVTAVTYGATIDVSGTACGGCTVEVMGNTDDDGEGEVYLGATVAEAGGAFVLALSTLGQPYLTATATDATMGTSEFSAPYEVPALRLRVYLPLVVVGR